MPKPRKEQSGDGTASSAAPQRYVAFLRAINVGGHTVKMDRLRALFEEIGFPGVETFIASGNVVFESPEAGDDALERRIEEHLRRSLGYEVATFVRSVDEVRAIADHQSFPASEIAASHALYVGFLKAAPAGEAREKVMALRTEIDDFHLHGRELYWLCRTKLSESTVSGAQIEKALGRAPATLRNANTVRRMADKYASGR